MKRKVGRPQKYNARDIHFNIKLNAKERDMLVDLMEDLNMSAPEVFRYILHTYYDEQYYR